MTKVAIILVNYKDYAQRFLIECRNSLRMQTYPQNLTQVYLIDNTSSPESYQYLKTNYPEAIILKRPDGNYCAANNTGIKQGLKDGCEYFVIANMDTIFDKNWLKELVISLEKNPQAGIAQSKILLASENNLINSLGNSLHFLGFGFTNGYKEKDRLIDGYPEISGYASGCSFIIRKATLEKIGFYNEEYYMYHDDIEMSWKTKLAGWQIILAPQSIVYHKYEFSRSVKMIYYMERNRYLVLFSFYQISTLILIFPTLLIMEIGMFFYAFKNDWFKTKLEIYQYFCKIETWRKIKKTRQEVGTIRKIKDKNIIQDMVGQVLFQEINNPILEYLVNPMMNIYLKIVKLIIF